VLCGHMNRNDQLNCEYKRDEPRHRLIFNLDKGVSSFNHLVTPISHLIYTRLSPQSVDLAVISGWLAHWDGCDSIAKSN
jgi:hypothetical protein